MKWRWPLLFCMWISMVTPRFFFASQVFSWRLGAFLLPTVSTSPFFIPLLATTPGCSKVSNFASLASPGELARWPRNAEGLATAESRENRIRHSLWAFKTVNSERETRHILSKSLEVGPLEILNVLFPTPPIAEHRQNVTPILVLFAVEKFSDDIAKIAFG